MRRVTTIASGAALLLMSTTPLVADGFTFYDFECEALRMTRTPGQLIYERYDPTADDDIVFGCEGRSCINRSPWDDGSGNTGIRVGYIYFPRGTMEFVHASASWRTGEDMPYHHVTSVTSLRPCGF